MKPYTEWQRKYDNRVTAPPAPRCDEECHTSGQWTGRVSIMHVSGCPNLIGFCFAEAAGGN